MWWASEGWRGRRVLWWLKDRSAGCALNDNSGAPSCAEDQQRHAVGGGVLALAADPRTTARRGVCPRTHSAQECHCRRQAILAAPSSATRSRPRCRESPLCLRHGTLASTGRGDARACPGASVSRQRGSHSGCPKQRHSQPPAVLPAQPELTAAWPRRACACACLSRPPAVAGGLKRPDRTPPAPARRARSTLVSVSQCKRPRASGPAAPPECTATPECKRRPVWQAARTSVRQAPQHRRRDALPQRHRPLLAHDLHHELRLRSHAQARTRTRTQRRSNVRHLAVVRREAAGRSSEAFRPLPKSFSGQHNARVLAHWLRGDVATDWASTRGRQRKSAARGRCASCAAPRGAARTIPNRGAAGACWCCSCRRTLTTSARAGEEAAAVAGRPSVRPAQWRKRCLWCAHQSGWCTGLPC